MKIAWAFNPFDSNKALLANGKTLLDSIRLPKSKVEVLFVASPNITQLATAFDVPESKRFTAYPTKILKDAIYNLGLDKVKVTTLPERSISLSASVLKLCGYLAKSKTDLTLIASNAGSGLSKLLIGSFAETAVHYAKTDLIVFHQETKVFDRSPQNLLFAHDLSKDSAKSLLKAMHYAKAWKAALTVLHVPLPAYGLKMDGQEKQVAAYRKDVDRQLAKIRASLQAAKIQGEVLLDARWLGTADLILEHAQRIDADLIAVHAKSGRFAALVGGSVTRQLIRKAETPILVIK